MLGKGRDSTKQAMLTGQKFAKKLLKIRPDFPVKGKMLIGNHIKFDEIADRILEGLVRSGLTVN